MRLAVLLTALAAVSTFTQIGLADDGGAIDGSTDRDTVAAVCDDGDECADGSADASSAAVVACDGDLCDTLQGRPSCSIEAAPASGAARALPWLAWLGGAAMALLIGLARRARRGA